MARTGRLRRLLPLLLAVVLLAPSGFVSASAEPAPNASSRAAAATALVERGRAIFDGDAGAAGAEATMVLRDLRVLDDALSPGQRATVARWTSFRGTEKAAPCAENTLLVINCDSAPAGFTAQDVLQAFTVSHKRYVGAGYKRPIREPGRTKTQIYVQNLGAGLYGFCTTDDTDIYVGDAASAWCAVNSDYSWSGISNLAAMRVTAAHEYFHAVQFAYDVTEDGWLLEGTAAWAEDEVFDGINDNYNYNAHGPITKPQLPMARFESGGTYHYGTWTFFRFLSERLTQSSNGMATVVRDIIRATDGAQAHSLSAINKVLAARGKSMTSMFSAFSDANRRPRRTYSEGANYPAKPLAGSVDLGSVGATKTFRALDMRQLSSRTYRFRPSGLTPTDIRLTLTFNLASKAAGAAAVVSVYRKGGTVKTVIVPVDSTGAGRRVTEFSGSTINQIEVTLVNSSTRMKSCWSSWSSPWSCYGAPVHNAMDSLVTGKVTRAS